MSRSGQCAIGALSADDCAREARELGALLHACVHDGACIGFVLPFGREESERFWTEKVVPRLRSGSLVLLVARESGRIAGSVQLDHDTPPNQAHRAEVRKLLVHPEFRRRGLGRGLMAALEERARRLGRSLLTLDTRSGDPAEALYASLGYRTAGLIPGYCRDPLADRLDPTTLMFKVL